MTNSSELLELIANCNVSKFPPYIGVIITAYRLLGMFFANFTVNGLVKDVMPVTFKFPLLMFFIFEFSLFRPGLDIGGIIIPKKLFRRILQWKK